MPKNLILVRHGESEGNIIQRAAKNSQTIYVPPEFLDRHTCDWRLTSKGIEQARKAGEWISKNIGTDFFRYYSSHYLRALETAYLLGLPKADWFKNHYIVERNWGILDRFLPEERAKIFAKDFESKKINPFYWAPPRGESMLSLCLRIEKVIETLHRECDGQNVIIVCHGEIMWAFRIILERITLHDYILLDESKVPQNRIHNCQIIHYSRINPQTKEQEKYFNWLRSVCPWDANLSTNNWQKIERQHFTNEQLQKFVKKTPRLIDS